jgi:Transmembrane secretion effector
MRGLSRTYRRFLTATGVSALGDGLLVTGLPLLARAATKSPLLVSLVFVGSRVPWVFGLVLGAAADRRDARRIMIGSDLFRGLLLSLLGAWLVVSDTPVPIIALIGLATLLAAGQITFYASSQRAVPHIVEPGDLEQANSSFTTIVTIGEHFVGPQLGAAFVSGGTFPIIGDAVSFVGSAALLAGLPPIPPEPTTSTLRQGVAEGWNWFRRDRLVRLVTAMMTSTACISGAALATEVILVRDTLKRSNWWFGAFTLTLAAGALIGSVLAPRVITRLGRQTAPLVIALSGLAYLTVAGSRSIPVVFGAMAFHQACTLVAAVNTISIRQRAIPAEIRGRVISLSRSFAHGSQIAGGAAGGWIAEHHGTDPLFVVAGIATVIVAVVAVRPLRRLLTPSPVLAPT